MRPRAQGLLLCAATALAAPACAPGSAERPPPEPDKAVVQPAVTANTDFALDLYSRLAREHEGKNLFFSPYSVSSGLAMVAEGARCETAAEMGKALRFPDVLKRTGDEAQTTPWNMTPVHAGMAALHDYFNAANQKAPEDVRQRAARLRQQLQEANSRARQLQHAAKFREGNTVALRAQKLAAELNALLSGSDRYELRVANALWSEKTYAFRQSYLDTVGKYYHTGGAFPVDFKNDYEGARQRINGWVEEQTNDRIKELIPKDALDPETAKLVRLVLTNAIYFKGEWSKVFEEEQTNYDDFTLAGGDKVRVPIMHHSNLDVSRYGAFNGDGTPFETPASLPSGDFDLKKAYPDDNGFAVLELPYKGETLTMVLAVPRSPDRLGAVEKLLAAGNLKAWTNKLEKREVNTYVPKFKLETKYDLEKTLQKMGMVRAFNEPGREDGAQLDEMSASSDPSQKLYVSKVLHQAFVEVTERGTEAAAATAVMAPAPTAPVSTPFTPTFKADRPFVFLIRDRKTETILFLGRVLNPKPGA